MLINFKVTQMSEDILARMEKIVGSNAKSIQALSDAVAQDRKEWAQDRRRVFEWMARLAAAQADFYRTIKRLTPRPLGRNMLE